MGEIYADRSSVEHLHEDRLLEPFERAKRLELVRKEAIIEHIARTALRRIVLHESLWPHFANRSGLEAFWALIHLIHPHHGQAFYDLLETLMPDWRSRKQRLERILS